MHTYSMAIKSGKEGYLLDHLGNHEGTLLIKDFRQNFQTRQNLVDLPIWGNEERRTVSTYCTFGSTANHTTSTQLGHCSDATHMVSKVMPKQKWA